MYIIAGARRTNHVSPRHITIFIDSNNHNSIASVWSHYEDNFDEFLNPFYEASDICILSPDPSPKKLRFWTGMHLRLWALLFGMVGVGIGVDMVCGVAFNITFRLLFAILSIQ